MPGPPKLPKKKKKKLTMGEAAKYVENIHGLAVTRQTVHRWATVGRGGVPLQTDQLAGRYFVTKEALDEFIHSCGI